MAPPRLRVLCLHGKRQDGEIFSQRLEKLARRLEPVAEFTFVDAPFELELEEVEIVLHSTMPNHCSWRPPPPARGFLISP
jgi:hypothetical protein